MPSASGFPGQRNYPVDRRGVIFSGATREPVVRGLTRPHSARIWRRKLWVNNSGYGEFGTAGDGAFVTVARLPGWTRGLAFAGGYAFVGVSRVIPRFSAYAPGLDVAEIGLRRLCRRGEHRQGGREHRLADGQSDLRRRMDRRARPRNRISVSGRRRHDTSRLERLFYGYRTVSQQERRR